MYSINSQFRTRDIARFARSVNNKQTSGATFRDAVKNDNGSWSIGGLRHNDGKGTLSLKK